MKGQGICGEKDDDGCGGQEKERNTKAEVGGQCKCGLEGEGTVVAKPGYVEATSHRSGN